MQKVRGMKQEFRAALDSYVNHFTASLEREYEAEKDGTNGRSGLHLRIPSPRLD